MKAQWFNEVHQIGEEKWQQAIGDTGYPFAQYAFHAALEDSGSVGGKTGWYPEYILLMEDDETPIGIVPTYLKTHSQGEFVFDWSWADAYQRYGYNYFPKRVWAVPFSPVTGPRIFTTLDPDGKSDEMLGLYAVVGDLLTQRTQQQKTSSWHLLFTKEHIRAAFEDEPVLARVSCQFHWFNKHYRDMEHYLSHFSSRKRKSARKERQKIVQQGIHLERKLGNTLSQTDVEFFYICYQSTYAKRGQRGYLTLAFFEHLIDSMGDQIVLVLAYREASPIAASWCFFDDHSLYGRYWGCIEEVDCLHFEACYYQGIEFCLEKGLQHFDPGTQGEHKIARGFEPVFSHSLHYIENEGFREAIGAFCREEAESVILYYKETANLLPFKEN
ncbi:GNAT family N-acetyltransferase [Marinomonas sp. 2405UD68-3]|uniref:GNAT family N-acetyltransferase n=1 Tax=Marinomonas sp. 2405UD68-3 TaxID=3391835 RepID=UPI0039C999F3